MFEFYGTDSIWVLWLTLDAGLFAKSWKEDFSSVHYSDFCYVLYYFWAFLEAMIWLIADEKLEYCLRDVSSLVVGFCLRISTFRPVSMYNCFYSLICRFVIFSPSLKGIWLKYSLLYYLWKRMPLTRWVVDGWNCYLSVMRIGERSVLVDVMLKGFGVVYLGDKLQAFILSNYESRLFTLGLTTSLNNFRLFCLLFFIYFEIMSFYDSQHFLSFLTSGS